MTLGLIRHFKVDAPAYTKFLSASEFSDSQKKYHECDVIEQKVDLDKIDWQVCYSSTLTRAMATAKSIYNGRVVFTEELVEVEASPVFNYGCKLSFNTWHVLARLAWLFGSATQYETRRQTKQRCNKLYSILKESGYQNILIVSHGFFLRELANFLIKKGYKGKIDYAPKNAKLYIFTDSVS
ncbi:MAG: histidine phosphatase family protein [Melioribacteraceae bacterium]|nr:histidine phosphatase family protein [Melioribacteraceae bacterium]